MSHHFGGSVDVGPLWLELMPVPTTATLYPIPLAFEDEDHYKGFSLDPKGSATGQRRRATINPASGELARLLSRN